MTSPLLRNQATSSDDLIQIETVSTSTDDDLLTRKACHTQTEESAFGKQSTLSDNDSDEYDDELEASGEEETSPKALVSSERENGLGNAEDSESQMALSVEPGGVENSEERTLSVNVNSAMDKVEVVAQKTVIKNHYIMDNVKFHWDNFNETKVTEEIMAAQRKTEKQLKSTEKTLKKKMKSCESAIKQCTEQLLLSRSVNNEEQNRQIAQLREEHDRTQQQLLELTRQTLDKFTQLQKDQEEARRKEKEATSYVFKLGGKYKRALEYAWTGLEQSQLVQLMKHLYAKFKIKLRQISVCCGMQFVVDVPPEEAESLAEQQAAIQEMIMEEILPESLQQEVTWEPAVPMPAEPEMNLPVQVTDAQDAAEGGGARRDENCSTKERTRTFDPMTAVPKQIFQAPIPTVATADGGSCRVTSLLVTDSKLLVFTDHINMKVLCMALDSTSTPALSPCLNVRPWDIAIFEHNVIAVASNTDVIFLLEVGSDAINVIKSVETERRYIGVASFGDGEELIASTVEDFLGPAVIDVITSEGKVLFRVADKTSLPGLHRPIFLHVWEREVLVSDMNGLIHRVDVTLRKVSPSLRHPQLKSPGQVTTDAGGNVYITGGQEGCVLVHSLSSGDWRPLLVAREHAEGQCVTPQAVGVTEDGVLVVSWERDKAESVVIGYRLNP